MPDAAASPPSGVSWKPPARGDCQGKARLSLPRPAAYIFAATGDSRMRLARFLVLMLPAFLLAASTAAGQERRVPASPAEVKLSYAPVVQKAAPAVVNVYAAKVVENRNPFFDDPFFRRFFGGEGGLPRERKAEFARLRRDRRCRRPGCDQQPRDRGRRRGEGGARRQARIRGGDRAEGPAYRSRRAAHQGFARALSGDRTRRLRRTAWSATWCWRSAILSPSARP